VDVKVLKTSMQINNAAMKNISFVIALSFLFVFVLSSCEKDDPEFIKGENAVIADHTIAYEDILRSIPDEYINAARNDLHIAYQHTSHGTHVSYGMFGLPGYKAGDETRFAISNNDPQADKLDFRDYAMASYTDASDLSQNETAFIQGTRDYLDDPDNSEINVVMWSWCNIAGHDVAGNYIPGMQTLINEYPSVSFIFMTGLFNVSNVRNPGSISLRIYFIQRRVQEVLCPEPDHHFHSTPDIYDNHITGGIRSRGFLGYKTVVLSELCENITSL
jgi:hypothetical protein